MEDRAPCGVTRGEVQAVVEDLVAAGTPALRAQLQVLPKSILRRIASSYHDTIFKGLIAKKHDTLDVEGLVDLIIIYRNFMVGVFPDE